MSFHKGPTKSSPAERGIRPYSGGRFPNGKKEFLRCRKVKRLRMARKQALPEACGKFSAAQNGFPHAPDAEGRKIPHGKPDGRHEGLFARFAGMIR